MKKFLSLALITVSAPLCAEMSFGQEYAAKLSEAQRTIIKDGSLGLTDQEIEAVADVLLKNIMHKKPAPTTKGLLKNQWRKAIIKAVRQMEKKVASGEISLELSAAATKELDSLSPDMQRRVCRTGGNDLSPGQVLIAFILNLPILLIEFPTTLPLVGPLFNVILGPIASILRELLGALLGAF